MRARLILVGILLGVLALGATSIYFLGQGEVHVLAMSEEKLTVRVDGAVVNPKHQEGRHLKFDLPRGQHTVALEREGASPREAKLEISSGFTRLVVPVSEEQCFARLDVSEAMYENSANKGKPRIDRRFPGGAPFALASSTYLTEEEMPNRRKKSQKVYLLVDYDCGATPSDAELIEEVWGD